MLLQGRILKLVKDLRWGYFLNMSLYSTVFEFFSALSQVVDVPGDSTGDTFLDRSIVL